MWQPPDMGHKTGLDWEQAENQTWILDTFGPKIGSHVEERSLRFIEEALELVQATGLSKERVLAMVEYTFGRPVGEPHQEVGGTLITLLALCSAVDVSAETAFKAELARCYENQDKIRDKAMNKALRGEGI